MSYSSTCTSDYDDALPAPHVMQVTSLSCSCLSWSIKEREFFTIPLHEMDLILTPTRLHSAIHQYIPIQLSSDKVWTRADDDWYEVCRRIQPGRNSTKVLKQHCGKRALKSVAEACFRLKRDTSHASCQIQVNRMKSHLPHMCLRTNHCSTL